MALLHLEDMDPEKDITIMINSPGGSISAGFMLVDTMKVLKCDVETICMGLAASMGAVILMAGTKGKRKALSVLSESGFNPEEGTLWSVGDLCDRGPEPLKVLDYLMSLPLFLPVVGNPWLLKTA